MVRVYMRCGVVETEQSQRPTRRRDHRVSYISRAAVSHGQGEKKKIRPGFESKIVSPWTSIKSADSKTPAEPRTGYVTVWQRAYPTKVLRVSSNGAATCRENVASIHRVGRKSRGDSHRAPASASNAVGRTNVNGSFMEFT
jgi:hypothetical protein